MSHEQEAGLTEVMLEEDLAGSVQKKKSKYNVILDWAKNKQICGSLAHVQFV